MSLISRRTFGLEDDSQRLTPGQEQLLMLAAALGPRLAFDPGQVSDPLVSGNLGPLMLRGLVRLGTSPGQAAAHLQVTPKGGQYLLKPPVRRRPGLWRRLPHQVKTRLMLLGSVTAVWLAARLWSRYF